MEQSAPAFLKNLLNELLDRDPVQGLGMDVPLQLHQVGSLEIGKAMNGNRSIGRIKFGSKKAVGRTRPRAYGWIQKQVAVGLDSISSCSSYFLDVGLHCPREVEVDDPSDVTLVQTHA